MSLQPVAAREHTIAIREYELSGTEIVNLLKRTGITIPDSAKVDVYVSVPGGGDWSNQDLEIDTDCPVKVTIQVETTR